METKHALSYQELKHKVESSYVYSSSKEFTKDLTAYLSYVYYLTAKESKTIVKKAQKMYNEPLDVLDYADVYAEDFSESKVSEEF